MFGRLSLIQDPTCTVNTLFKPLHPLFKGKLISPLPPPLHPYSSQTINVYWSVKFYSGWKFILLLVFGVMTSNFMCLTFSTWRSSTSSLWRIVTQIFLWLEKDSITPGNHKSVLRENPCCRWWFSLYLIPSSLLSPPPPSIKSAWKNGFTVYVFPALSSKIKNCARSFRSTGRGLEPSRNVNSIEEAEAIILKSYL